MRIDPDECHDPELLAAEVRRLNAVIAAGEPTITDTAADDAREIERLQRSVTDWRLEAEVHRKRAAAAVAEVRRLQNIVSGYTDGIAAGSESKTALTDAERDRHHIPDAGKMAEGPTNHDSAYARVAPGYLGDGVSPSHNDKNLHHILTAEERQAIEWYAGFVDGLHIDTLRKLLERLT